MPVEQPTVNSTSASTTDDTVEMSTVLTPQNNSNNNKTASMESAPATVVVFDSANKGTTTDATTNNIIVGVVKAEPLEIAHTMEIRQSRRRRRVFALFITLLICGMIAHRFCHDHHHHYRGHHKLHGRHNHDTSEELPLYDGMPQREGGEDMITLDPREMTPNDGFGEGANGMDSNPNTPYEHVTKQMEGAHKWCGKRLKRQELRPSLETKAVERLQQLLTRLLGAAPSALPVNRQAELIDPIPPHLQRTHKTKEHHGGHHHHNKKHKHEKKLAQLGSGLTKSNGQQQDPSHYNGVHEWLEYITTDYYDYKLTPQSQSELLNAVSATSVSQQQEAEGGRPQVSVLPALINEEDTVMLQPIVVECHNSTGACVEIYDAFPDDDENELFNNNEQFAAIYTEKKRNENQEEKPAPGFCGRMKNFFRRGKDRIRGRGRRHHDDGDETRLPQEEDIDSVMTAEDDASTPDHSHMTKPMPRPEHRPPHHHDGEERNMHEKKNKKSHSNSHSLSHKAKFETTSDNDDATDVDEGQEEEKPKGFLGRIKNFFHRGPHHYHSEEKDDKKEVRGGGAKKHHHHHRHHDDEEHEIHDDNDAKKGHKKSPSHSLRNFFRSHRKGEGKHSHSHSHSLAVDPKRNAASASVSSSRRRTSKYLCLDGSFVRGEDRCDGFEDCADGSDEVLCQTPNYPIADAFANDDLIARDESILKELEEKMNSEQREGPMDVSNSKDGVSYAALHARTKVRQEARTLFAAATCNGCACWVSGSQVHSGNPWFEMGIVSKMTPDFSSMHPTGQRCHPDYTASIHIEMYKKTGFCRKAICCIRQSDCVKCHFDNVTAHPGKCREKVENATEAPGANATQ